MLQFKCRHCENPKTGVLSVFALVDRNTQDRRNNHQVRYNAQSHQSLAATQRSAVILASRGDVQPYLSLAGCPKSAPRSVLKWL